MKKGWTSKHIKERFWGKQYDRWYIKSPSGNFYFLHRCHEGKHPSCAILYLAQDMTDMYDAKKELKKKPIPMLVQTSDGLDKLKLNSALQEIYKIEETGTYSKELRDVSTFYGIDVDERYPKELSDSIENHPECKKLYAS